MPHSLLYSIARVSGLGAITVLIAVSFAGAETPSTYKDPAEYCKAVGTIDAPDSRYTGPKTPDWMTTVFYTPDQIAEQKSAGVDPTTAVVWRCAEGAVLVCVQANSPHCGKADTNKTPTQAMNDFCAKSPNTEIIPLSVIGHENPMIYQWGCRGKEPFIIQQILQVDAQGYPAGLWQQVTP